MKLLTYSHGSEYAVGVLKNDGSEVVPVNYLGFDVKDMNEFLEPSFFRTPTAYSLPWLYVKSFI